MTENTNMNYTIILDETCALHGEKNFAYQYDDENWVRTESVCSQCAPTNPRQKRAETHRTSERPQRPTRPGRG